MTGVGARRAARRLRGFVRRHGATTCLPEPVGLDVVRLVVVGADGVFGDLVLRRLSADAVVVQVPGASVGNWASAPSVLTGGVEWRRMAGMQLAGR